MSPQEALGTRLSRLDRWGIIISSACLVHCLALPLVLALLPAFASSLPPDSWVHPVLIGMALPVTGAALWRGYRLHRRAGPALTGVTGLALIAAALLARGGPAEPALTVMGGLIVSAAHIFNWRRHCAEEACRG